MHIINHRKIFYTLSAVLIAVCILAISVLGLRLGIDFVGGSLLSVSFEGEVPTSLEVVESLKSVGIEDALVQTSGNGFMIRSASMTEKEVAMEALTFGGRFAPVENGFSAIGPVLGKEAINKSWVSIILVLAGIILFVAFSFRKVSISAGSGVSRVPSFVYGVIAVLALLHDVIIPTGIFAILGYFYGFEVDTLFVTALLVIIGFSVHDTIVVFDRVRENLHLNENKKEHKDFETVVGESISQTLVRSINTSLTTMLAVVVLLLVGPESVREFSIVLLIGLAVGTYSSIFIGSPLLVTFNNWKSKRLT